MKAKSPNAQLGKYHDRWGRLNGLLHSGRSLSGRERNCCFLNLRDGHFGDVSAISGIDFAEDARAVALMDWDFDGDLDVWITNRTQPRIRFLRNDVGGNHNFLALSLEGKSCNRDAIGARIEAHLPSGDVLLRSLRAGDGFVTQTSKRLHFGLGKAERIERLIVHWPGGKQQEFSSLDANHCYAIMQGEPEVTTIDVPRTNASLSPSASEFPKAKSSGIRIGMVKSFPLPTINYWSWDGKFLGLDLPRQNPILINLWSSSCLPCLKELSDFSEYEKDIRAQGVDVIALCVDGLRDWQSKDVATSKDYLKRCDFPFLNGMTTYDSARKLGILTDSLFSNIDGPALPVSFLVEPEGCVAAVYLGSIDIPAMLSDVAKVKASGTKPANLALPFPGVWLRGPVRLRDQLFHIGTTLATGGYPRDSLGYLRLALELDPRSKDARNNYDLALATISKSDANVRLCTDMLQTQPKSPQLHFELGVALLHQGDVKRATRHLKEAARYAPDDVNVHMELARVLRREGNLSQAGFYLRRVLEIDSGHSQALRIKQEIDATRTTPERHSASEKDVARSPADD